MEFVYIGMAMVFGVVIGALFIDVDSVANLWAKKEEELDVKEEHKENK